MDDMTIQTTMRSLSGVGRLPGSPEVPLAAPGVGSGLEDLDMGSGGSMPVGGSSSFKETLAEYMDGVNEQLLEVDKGMADLASGKSANIHNTLIAMQKADLQVKLLVETRNKVLRAYEEIMRMQA
jgi:flagellar hook-basal body complex protein FliE